MSEKQKEVLEKFGEVIKDMSDEELEKVLLVGTGMGIMSDVRNKNSTAAEAAEEKKAG